MYKLHVLENFGNGQFCPNKNNHRNIEEGVRIPQRYIPEFQMNELNLPTQERYYALDIGLQVILVVEMDNNMSYQILNYSNSKNM